MKHKLPYEAREIFLNKIDKSIKEYEEGKFHSARTVFDELRKKYKY